MLKTNELTELIRKRRSVFPHMYEQTPISDEILMEILENANWAPTHRLTEPWRFKIFRGDSLEKLSEYLGDYYENNTEPEQYSERKHLKTKAKPLKSSCVIAICIQRDETGKVPETEEISSVAMAVQNMWLTCTALGIGSYWSSPKAAYHADKFLELQQGEKCLGLFYMGYYEGPELQGKRGDIRSKIRWM